MNLDNKYIYTNSNILEKLIKFITNISNKKIKVSNCSYCGEKFNLAYNYKYKNSNKTKT